MADLPSRWKRFLLRAERDWPVWAQVVGFLCVCVGVGVVFGVGYALLADGCAVLAAGVWLERDGSEGTP